MLVFEPVLAWDNFSLMQDKDDARLKINNSQEGRPVFLSDTLDLRLQKVFTKLSYRYLLEDGREVVFQPFSGSHLDVAGIRSMLSEEKEVYQKLRHLGPWDDALLLKTFKRYATGVNTSLNDLKDGIFLWTPGFDLCFVLYIFEKNGRVHFVGRGGFQKENSIDPETTEVYFAILPKYQNLGIGTQFGLFLKDLWNKTFNTEGKVLRGLYLASGNPGSEKILRKMGMQPILRGGAPVEIIVKEWENSRYFALELRSDDK